MTYFLLDAPKTYYPPFLRWVKCHVNADSKAPDQPVNPQSLIWEIYTLRVRGEIEAKLWVFDEIHIFTIRDMLKTRDMLKIQSIELLKCTWIEDLTRVIIWFTFLWRYNMCVLSFSLFIRTNNVHKYVVTSDNTAHVMCQVFMRVSFVSFSSIK